MEISKSFNVTVIQSRPAFLPSPFVIGRNNLNPKLNLDANGLKIKVVMETDVPFSDIEEVEIKDGLGGKKYLTLDCGG